MAAQTLNGAGLTLNLVGLTLNGDVSSGSTGGAPGIDYRAWQIANLHAQQALHATRVRDDDGILTGAPR